MSTRGYDPCHLRCRRNVCLVPARPTTNCRGYGSPGSSLGPAESRGHIRNVKRRLDLRLSAEVRHGPPARPEPGKIAARLTRKRRKWERLVAKGRRSVLVVALILHYDFHVGDGTVPLALPDLTPCDAARCPLGSEASLEVLCSQGPFWSSFEVRFTVVDRSRTKFGGSAKRNLQFI